MYKVELRDCLKTRYQSRRREFAMLIVAGYFMQSPPAWTTVQSPKGDFVSCSLRLQSPGEVFRQSLSSTLRKMKGGENG
jgi:hypothetical protein